MGFVIAPVLDVSALSFQQNFDDSFEKFDSPLSNHHADIPSRRVTCLVPLNTTVLFLLTRFVFFDTCGTGAGTSPHASCSRLAIDAVAIAT